MRSSRLVMAAGIMLLALALVVPVRGDVLLIKVDLNQVDFPALMIKSGGAAAGGMGEMPLRPAPDGPLWLFGQFEMKPPIDPKVPNVFEQPAGMEHKLLNVEKKLLVPMGSYFGSREIKHRLAKDFTTREKKEGPSLDLAKWAFARGLRKEFQKVMAALPATNPAAANYAKLQQAMKTAPEDEDPHLKPFLDELRREDFKSSATTQGHFAVVYQPVSDGSDASLRKKLTLLEDAFDNFYTWFALQSNVTVPALPRYKLSVVLVNSPQEFGKRQVVFGSSGLTHDGFLARRDNLLVLSPRCLDESFNFLEKNLLAVRQAQQLSRDQLLTGTVWTQKKAEITSLDQVFKIGVIQALQVLHKSMEDEAELSTLSYLTARQLIAASGLINSHVQGPEWIQYGLASFFEVSPGALQPGAGQPSLQQTLHFRKRALKAAPPAELLKMLAGDRMFQQSFALERRLRELERTDGDKKERAALAGVLQASKELAQSTAWSFVYYLVQKGKTNQLMEYCKLLNSMPRDLELTDRALIACFAGAFGLADARDPTVLDAAKVQSLAADWFRTMETTPIDSEQEAFRTIPTKAGP